MLKSFGQHLKEIRLSQNLSQEDLASRAGLDRTYIKSNLSLTLKTMSNYGLVDMVRDKRQIRPVAKATEFYILAA